MSELLKELADNVPHFHALVVGPLVVLIMQLLFLRSSLTQRRRCIALEDRILNDGWSSVADAKIPPWWPAFLAGASVLVIVGVGGWSITAARTAFHEALTGSDPSEKAERISRSFSGMFNAVPWSINQFVLCGLLSMVSVTMWMVTRQRVKRLLATAGSDGSHDSAAVLASCRGPGSDNLTVLPVLLFMAGLFPVISGAWAHSLELVHGLATLAPLPVEQKMPHLVDSLVRSHAIFAGRAWLAWPGTMLATLAAAVLLVVWRRRSTSVPSGWTTVFVCQSCVLGAIALFVAAAPYQAKNGMQWPAPSTGSDKLLIDDPQAPKLQGPDLVERAPILWFAERQVSLDGYRTDPDGIEDTLRVSARNFRWLNPGAEWRGRLLVLAAAQTPTQTLTAYLRAAQRAGFSHPIFIFTKRETLNRPILGTVSRVHVTGAGATLVTDGDGNDEDESAVRVHGSAFPTYDGLAHRLVELRLADSEVALEI